MAEEPQLIQAQPVMIHPEQMAMLQNCMQAQLGRYSTNERRHKVEDLVKRTHICDGSNYRALKRWLRELDYVQNYTTDETVRIDVALQTADGELRDELEQFLTTYAASAAPHPIPRNQTPWNDLKDHISKTFMPPNEVEELKEKLLKMKQGPGETIATFNRRFKAAAEEAYPTAQRNQDQQQTLMKAYLAALLDLQVRRPVVHSAPQTLAEAMLKATEVALAEKRLEAMDSPAPRAEEPMDISAVQPTPTLLNETDINQLIDQKLAALSISAISHAPLIKHSKFQPKHPKQNSRSSGSNTRYTNPLAWTVDGQPICYECGKANHLAKQCLLRRQRMYNEQTYIPKQTNRQQDGSKRLPRPNLDSTNPDRYRSHYHNSHNYSRQYPNHLN